MRATSTERTLDEADVFTDLVLADDELVREEFDALIAACWEAPCEPPTRMPGPAAGPWAWRPPRRWSRASAAAAQPPARASAGAKQLLTDLTETALCTEEVRTPDIDGILTR
jgi:hypothetical protein